MYQMNAAICLAPISHEHIARAAGDLRMGLPCLLRHDAERYVATAVETLNADRFAALISRFGTPELVITPERAWSIMSSAAASDVEISPVRIRPPENAGLDWYSRLADTQVDTPGAPWVRCIYCGSAIPTCSVWAFTWSRRQSYCLP